MVVDASAILAVLLKEEDRIIYIKRLVEDYRKFISPINALEADLVITSKFGAPGKAHLDNFMFHCKIDIVPFTHGMQELAFDAWERYGKGRNEAKLNMGDCCAYALSKALNEPLLFKSNDFTKTDVKAVLQATD